jgi:hypothetical protein
MCPSIFKRTRSFRLRLNTRNVGRPDAYTYLPKQGACAYLSLITDMWSRRIVGYHVHDTLQTRQVSQALKMALKTRQTRQTLIHHSDRGIQYCSDEYQQLHSTQYASNRPTYAKAGESAQCWMGSSSSIRAFGQVGSFSRVDLSQAVGSSPLSLAVVSKL